MSNTLQNNWIEFGNRAIGIGTFALAMVLGTITLIGSNKDRKVHIADKRQEWIVTFRKQIAGILTVQHQFMLQIDDCSVAELDAILKELNTLNNEVKFMFHSKDKNREKLDDLFTEIFEDLKARNMNSIIGKQISSN